ncbi:MAG: homoserine dehydrogenase [Candidatus Hydrogenedentes bacterium]|nr:homoserine dehydrogenase [Candidatus Hydrogenedentota bacterium]
MPLGVGVIGAGVVGGGVIRTLLSNAGVIRDKTGLEVVLRHVAEINQGNLKEFDLEGIRVSSDAKSLYDDPTVDVVCELIGGMEPAKSFILGAMAAGKHVVTANKMLLAQAGAELTAAAQKHGVHLRYEAAVAGGIPIIKALREGLAANHIRSIYAILNGTCNYILTRMTYEDLEFEAALKRAQELGFAETPPDLDVDGWDTAHKCQILASLCYSTRVNLDDIFVEGVRNVTHLDVAYAREMGYVIKLLAIIRRGDTEIEARVHPTLVPEAMLLAQVRNEFNGIYVESDIADATMYYGRGAGRMPTASAVVADIIDIARARETPPPSPFRYTHEIDIRDIGLLEGRYYLRMTTLDEPGVLGEICTILGKHRVGIASIIQKEEAEDTPAHIVITTHTTIESSVMAALAEIDPLRFVTEPTHVMRML